ncbi:regulatory protein, luxR family [Salinimicrobium sediminis]|uniref:Regulatory protein, luxR family n=1 Tax=Salinimicrobium sediminis TaxID=1343891 RepID=A0A285X4C6_9FLAO|nr:helix-turn-helix transcriptional regulator [Salinimicrobium sediminis]SOC79856.1 regulatory protein, luxR family [Salinimicrobium sediminis]
MELSKAEYRVAELVARGLSEKEIASELFISPKTVHTHTYNIRKKWSARSAVDVARKFILALDNPKQFFTVVVFLVMQGHIIVTAADLDLRKPPRSISRTTRAGRSGKKNQYQW